MRTVDVLVQQTLPQEECVVILRSFSGTHILNAPLDMTDAELLDVLCAAQDIVTQRLHTPATPPPPSLVTEPVDESNTITANV